MADKITLTLRTEDGEEEEVVVDRNAEELDVGEADLCLSGGCSPPLASSCRSEALSSCRARSDSCRR